MAPVSFSHKYDSPKGGRQPGDEPSSSTLKLPVTVKPTRRKQISWRVIALPLGVLGFIALTIPRYEKLSRRDEPAWKAKAGNVGPVPPALLEHRPLVHEAPPHSVGPATPDPAALAAVARLRENLAQCLAEVPPNDSLVESSRRLTSGASELTLDASKLTSDASESFLGSHAVGCKRVIGCATLVGFFGAIALLLKARNGVDSQDAIFAYAFTGFAVLLVSTMAGLIAVDWLDRLQEAHLTAKKRDAEKDRIAQLKKTNTNSKTIEKTGSQNQNRTIKVQIEVLPSIFEGVDETEEETG
eukprot:GHVT01074280.1.p1 GENE.GHVT01074280.1~~GHVT01074280.1.p1  ORF type:complete len:299 (-),score=39.40 GHVT01074280.1:886-1782(-)